MYSELGGKYLQKFIRLQIPILARPFFSAHTVTLKTTQEISIISGMPFVGGVNLYPK